jgi:hypothetical protein
MSTMGVTKREEEQPLQLFQGIKEDTDYIKLRLSIGNVDLEELTEEEKRDFDGGIKDLKSGEAVKRGNSKYKISLSRKVQKEYEMVHRVPHYSFCSRYRNK